MNKTIIVVKGHSNQGKTQSIHTLFTELKKIDCKLIEENFYNSDIKAIVEFKGQKIGICSIGDPNSAQADLLTDLVSKDCNIIITASRTRGETIEIIEHLANQHKYATIYTSNYIYNKEEDTTMYEKLNNQFAHAIIELIKHL